MVLKSHFHAIFTADYLVQECSDNQKLEVQSWLENKYEWLSSQHPSYNALVPHHVHGSKTAGIVTSFSLPTHLDFIFRQIISI